LTAISFTVAKTDVEAAREICDTVAAEIGATNVTTDTGIGRVSIVGAGMKSSPGVTALMFETLYDHGINIEMISTSSIRISCVVRADKVGEAVRALHSAFGLDATS
jgi:aspartate kinase